MASKYFTAVEQTLPEYVPLPMEQLFQAGQAIQSRYDNTMSSIDNTATGLASMEALAPAYKNYRDNLVSNYRTEVSSLLDKFGNRASDPQFIREIKRINNKYAADPNLGTIRLGNESIKTKQKNIQDIYTKGGKYLDTNPNFTGADSLGNLIYDAGQVKKTTFEEDLNKAFENASKGIMDDGSLSTNKTALDSVLNSLVTGAGTNPTTREALQYYLQQGYSPEQAQEQLKNNLQQLYGSYLTAKKVDTNERLQLARQANSISAMNAQTSRMRYGLEAQKYADEKAEKAYGNQLLSESGAIESINTNKNLISNVDQALRLYDQNGKVREGKFNIANTPENRSKYPNAKLVSMSGGVGAPGQSFLEVNSKVANKQDQGIIQAAREVVDPNNKQKLSDQQVLKAYKLQLQQDNNAPTFWNTPIKETRDNLVRYYAGNNGENLTDAVLVQPNGKTKRVADGDVNLAELKHFDFAGYTASPVRVGNSTIPSGAIKISAIDKKGNPIIFMKPADPMLQSRTRLTNLISRANTSGLSNAQLRENPEFIQQVGQNTFVAPQRNKDGQVDFYQIINGKTVGDPIDPSTYIQAENAELGRFFGQGFKNKQ